MKMINRGCCNMNIAFVFTEQDEESKLLLIIVTHFAAAQSDIHI